VAWPPAVSDFEAYFTREFNYGEGADFVQDNDVQRAINDALGLFNVSIWPDTTTQQTAFFYLAAHMLWTNIQNAGGLGPGKGPTGGLSTTGAGFIETKAAGSLSVGYAEIAERIKNSPILSQFMQSPFGQKYLVYLWPRITGVIYITAPATQGMDGQAPYE
jgi:Protein of unknown function (DUF4054)